MRNRDKMLMNEGRVQQRFSIRKLTIGTASVLLGTIMFWSSPVAVHADKVDTSASEQNAVVEDSNSTTSSQKQEAQSDKTDTATDSQTQDSTNSSSQTAENNAATAKSDTSQTSDTAATDDATKDSKKSVVSTEFSPIDNPQSATIDISGGETTKAQSPTASITTTKVSANGQDTGTTVDSSSDQRYEMTAGEGAVNVHVKLDNLTANDQELYMHFTNVGSNFPLKVASNQLQPGQSITSGNWTLQNLSGDVDTTIYAKWNSTEATPTSLSFNLPIQGNTSTVKTDTDADVDFSVYLPDSDYANQTYTQNILDATIHPYQDKVQDDEVLKGFVINNGYDSSNPITVGTEKSYNNISDADYNALKNSAEFKDLTEDEFNNIRIVQYGFYFNYNTYLNDQALQDAVYKILLQGNQTLIPSSIKAYEVSKDLALDSTTGERHGINDTMADGKTYYNAITQSQNESKAFENYLKNQIDTSDTPDYDYFNSGNEISDDQSGTFTVPGIDDAANKAYFFQVDAVLTELPGDDDLSHTWMEFGTGNRTNTAVYPFASISVDSSQQAVVHHVSNTKTIQRTVNYLTDDTHEVLLDPTTDSITLSQDYYYIVQDGKIVYVNGTLEVDEDNTATPNDDSWKITSGSAFDSIDKSTITNGKIAGTWTRSSAARDSESGPAVENEVVPAESESDLASQTSNQQVYTIYYVHGTQTTTEYKSVVENIKYIDETNGDEIADAHQSATLNFTREKTTDLVTGDSTYTAWTSADNNWSLPAVDNPSITNYVIDPTKITVQFNNGSAEPVSDSTIVSGDSQQINALDLTADNLAEQLPAETNTITVVVPYTHATKTETQTATVNETIKGYYADGTKAKNFDGMDDLNTTVPENDETGDPDYTASVTYTRNRTIDLVKDPDGTTTKWSEWSANGSLPAVAYDNTTIKDSLPDYYYLDKDGVVHITGTQDGFSVSVDPKTGISEIVPSSEFLASIAETKTNGQVTAQGSTAQINIWVPYHQDIPQPDVPTTPSQDQPSKPDYPTPNEPATPVTPDEPTQSSQPTQSTNTVEPPKATTPDKPESTNSNGHSSDWSHNIQPKGQDVDEQSSSTHKLQGQTTNENIAPKGQTIATAASNKSAETNARPLANSAATKTNTLPQTGESKSSLGLIGLGLAAVASLLGLTGTKKRKE